jgi:hypothetical protein
MMRPPPGGTFAQSACFSAPQNERIASASRGRICGIGSSGATTGAAGAAAGGDGRRRSGRCAALANGRYGTPARRRELRRIDLQALQGRGAARLHSGAMCDEIGAARGASGADLLLGRLLGYGRRGRWLSRRCGALTRAGSGFVAAGGGAAPSVAGFAPTTSSAHRHAADTLPAFRCMPHGNAWSSLPPSLHYSCHAA